MMKSVMAASALTLSLALGGCATSDFERGVQSVRENNPFRNFGQKQEEPAPVTTGQTSGTADTTGAATASSPPATQTVAETPAATAPGVSGPTYELPTGGGNTISLSVASCLVGCPVVNVLLDPDGYWQRTAPEGQSTGTASTDLYNQVVNVFQSQGFYAFTGELNIVPGNETTCSDYQAGGQAFFMSLARNNSARRITYDTGCAGSPSAEGAGESINALIGVSEFMQIVSGTAS